MTQSALETDSNYYIYDQYGDNQMDPVGPVGLIDLAGSRDFTRLVNDFLYRRRLEYLDRTPEVADNRPGFLRRDYRLDAECTRWATGEGFAKLNSTARGHDVYILCDVHNYSCSYELFGKRKPMSPDEHYQDLKRVILAISGKARRINVIMPLLYSGRQHKRNGRESLDSAFMLEELSRLDVANLLTFDAHDPRVANSVPISGFENIRPTYQIIKAMKRHVPSLHAINEDFMVIAPDEGALSRAMYFSRMLNAPLGTFYKRRDYTRIVDGRNPILSHEFLGDDADGLSVLIVDDMISSGDSMLDIAREMKARRAKHVYCAATFALFADGVERFDQAHEEGLFDLVFATNLTYRRPELLRRDWFVDVNMTKYVALLIDAINHDASLSMLLDPTTKIRNLLSSDATPRDPAAELQGSPVALRGGEAHA